jgi:MinD-like ATPase involved in chromosome partitioning or flagellar assembly
VRENVVLRVTFYSYKGGVGRTLALLNVAAILARHGQRVVAVDLDLEAPGFGLSRVTAHPASQLGVSDFILDRRVRGELPLTDYVYPVLKDECEDRLHLMPAGTRGRELIRRLPSFYADLEGDDALAFQLLVAEIGHVLAPDYLLFDSRTGLADVAGVCTIELPQVLVAVCGLSEQNIQGMAAVLDELAEHPARDEGVAHVLVMSPVPRAEDLGVRSVEGVLARLGADVPGQFDRALLEQEQRSNLLLRRLMHAQVALMPRIYKQFEDKARRYFPRSDRSDLYHELPYDPETSLCDDEILPDRSSLLGTRYRMLARTLARMHQSALVPDVPGMQRAPLLLFDNT